MKLVDWLQEAAPPIRQSTAHCHTPLIRENTQVDMKDQEGI